VNFGNGYEFAVIDEPGGASPRRARTRQRTDGEVVRDNSDHLFPTFNTHIPDAPLLEDPTRFNRFDRFKQVFESRSSIAARCLQTAGVCRSLLSERPWRRRKRYQSERA
jgi:hypothetical protein